eukprot:990559_1
MSRFTGHTDYDPPYVPPEHRPRLQRKHQKHSTLSSKVYRPLTRFYCNDCKKKFQSRILANRNKNAVQHYCSVYRKIITRKLNNHSKKCKGYHGMGPCVIRHTDTNSESDGEDETKVAYYANHTKKRPKFKRTRAHAKKRKLDDDYASIPSKKQRRNHNKCPLPSEHSYANNHTYLPPPSNVYPASHQDGCRQSSDTRDPYYPQQLTPTPPIIPPRQNGNVRSLEYNDGSHEKPQTEQEQQEQDHRMDENTEFEVLNINKHIVLDGEILYRVSWKSCYYKSVNQFLPWIKEMKKVQKHSTLRWKVDWKDSWVPQQDLHCADLLAAYILTDLKKRSEAEIARNRFKQCCCQMLHYAEAQ